MNRIRAKMIIALWAVLLLQACWTLGGEDEQAKDSKGEWTEGPW